MNDDEETIKKHLESIGYKDPVFEPNGNIPPDFLIDGKIAVEVRRLNQQTALEEDWHSLTDKINDLCLEIQDAEQQNSAFITVKFKRPLNVSTKDIREILEKHLPHIDEEISYQLRDNLKINIKPTSNRLENVYYLGKSIDRDRDGYVLSNLCENLKFIIPEKADKIALHQHKYQTWWLALVDHIDHVSIDNEELDLLQEPPIDKGPFEKILLVSPLDSKRWVEF